MEGGQRWVQTQKDGSVSRRHRLFRRFAPIAAVAVIASVAGYAFASQGEDHAGGSLPAGTYDGSSEAVWQELEDRARGDRASENFDARTVEAVSRIPVEDRLEYEPVDCATVGLETGLGCVDGRVSDAIRKIDPTITADDVRWWDGSSVAPDDLEQVQCEALKKVGYDGPFCPARPDE